MGAGTTSFHFLYRTAGAVAVLDKNQKRTNGKGHNPATHLSFESHFENQNDLLQLVKTRDVLINRRCPA
jgi:hypothetical protein